MPIEQADVTRVASAALGRILTHYLPRGDFAFGGIYMAASPKASGYARDLRELRVQRSGEWRDANNGAHGEGPESLVAYITGTATSRATEALAKLLDYSDAMLDRPVRAQPLRKAKEKAERDVAGELLRKFAAARCTPAERAELLLQAALADRPKRRYR